MTVAELRERMRSDELTDWIAYDAWLIAAEQRAVRESQVAAQLKINAAELWKRWAATTEDANDWLAYDAWLVEAEQQAALDAKAKAGLGDAAQLARKV